MTNSNIMLESNKTVDHSIKNWDGAVKPARVIEYIFVALGTLFLLAVKFFLGYKLTNEI